MKVGLLWVYFNWKKSQILDGVYNCTRNFSDGYKDSYKI